MSRLKTISSRLTYANVMATLAFFGVLSGAAYASGTITGKQIKDNTIKSRDIHNGTISSKDIQDGSIGAADLSAGAAGNPYVPFSGSTAIGTEVPVVLNGFTFKINCTASGVDAVLLAPSASDFTYHSVLAQNGSTVQNLYSDWNKSSLGDGWVMTGGDTATFELTGMTVSLSGTGPGVFAISHVNWNTGGCLYYGELFPLSP